MKNLYLLLLLLPYYAVSQCGAGYTEPTFQLAKTDPTCAGNDGAVSVINLQNGVGPYTYKIVSPSPSRIGEQNTTGNFSNITTGGEYYIQLEDGCGTIRVRHITITPFSVDFLFNVSLNGCKRVNVNVTSLNVPVTMHYGFVAGADTTWSNSSIFNAGIGDYRSGKVLLKDTCGNVFERPWALDSSLFPQITAIDPYFHCNNWDATVRSERFANPTTYCLYTINNQLVGCNTSGIFPGIPYGEYYAIASDTCYRDSFYVKNDSAAIGVQFDGSDYTCTSFTLTIPSLPVNGTICLYDSVGQQIGCNATGIFTSIPYGTYCVKIYDPCSGDTISFCKGVFYPDLLLVTARAECSLDSTRLDFSFNSLYGNEYDVRIYRPDNSLMVHQQVTTTNSSITLPVVTQYKVVTTDSCGSEHVQYVLPRPLWVGHSFVVTPKCPGAIWPNGSGDLKVTNMADDIVWPTIVSKNGQPVNISATQTQGSDNFFIDLEPATYIIKYNLVQCTAQVFDTVTIQPYVYPMVRADSVNQCDGGPMLLNARARNGIRPFTYEILGSTPSTPSVVTPAQTDSLFNIYNGTTYSQLRVRAIDNCGNSALQNIPVLPIDCNVLETDSTRRGRTPDKFSAVRIYPNPSTSAFRIFLNRKAQYIIQVIAVDGVKLVESSVSNANEYEIRRPLQRGTYFIHVIDVSTNKTQVFKHIRL